MTNEEYRKKELEKHRDTARVNNMFGQEQTNEEWFCLLSTEDKADFLKKIIKSCGWCLDGGNPPFCLLSGNKCLFNDGDFVEWLKQPHTKKRG